MPGDSSLFEQSSTLGQLFQAMHRNMQLQGPEVMAGFQSARTMERLLDFESDLDSEDEPFFVDQASENIFTRIANSVSIAGTKRGFSFLKKNYKFYRVQAQKTRTRKLCTYFVIVSIKINIKTLKDYN